MPRGRRRAGGAGRMSVRRMTGRRTRRMVARMRRRRRRRRRRRIILVGGMIAVGAYALSKQDSQRVEEYTGKSAEELSDEEIEQAMDNLGIDAEEMSDEQWAQVEAADSKEDDYIEQLERLAELRDKGIITDAEFEAKKAKLLDI